MELTRETLRLGKELVWLYIYITINNKDTTMIQLKDMPTDIYGRYRALAKELIAAVGTADRSEDNRLMLLENLKVLCKECNFNISDGKAKDKPTKPKKK